MKKDLDYLLENNVIEWYNTLKSREYNRMHRLYQNITYWYHWTTYTYFVTFTIDNHYLSKSLQFERFLKQVLNINKIEKYMFNPDLSPKKGRLHFHALVYTNEILQPNELEWRFGFIDLRQVTVFNKKALGKYITKLTNHALKGTTPKIYYSRKKRD